MKKKDLGLEDWMKEGQIHTGFSKPMSGDTAVIAACDRAPGRAFAGKALLSSRLSGPFA